MQSSLDKRLSAIEANRPKPRQITQAERLRWIEAQYISGNLQIDAGTVIVNPTLQTSPLHFRVLASVARAATKAGIGRKYA